jgi:hypothetical protein
MPDPDLRARLVALGPDALADALLRLADEHEAVHERVQSIVATPSEKLTRVRRALGGLARRRRFVHYREAPEFARQLRSILEELRGSGCDPVTGLDLVGRFFEQDARTLGACDDSAGIVGDVYRIDAADAWAHFADAVDDPDLLVDRTFALIGTDDFGVRDAVLDRIDTWLPRAHVDRLVERLWERAAEERAAQERAAAERAAGDRWRPNRPHALLNIERIAKAVVDPELFERATVEWTGGEVGGLDAQIAQVYLAAERPRDALRWLERDDGRVSPRAYEQRQMTKEAYRQLGRTDRVEAMVRADFERHPGVTGLDELVALLGEDARAGLIDEAVTRIEAGDDFDPAIVGFLLEVGRPDTAAAQVVEHRDRIDGRDWYAWGSVADALREAHQPLAATCVTRALLVSILDIARTKAYGHGRRMWARLITLADAIDDWHDVEPHPAFGERLYERHRRKRSFWDKVPSQQRP